MIARGVLLTDYQEEIKGMSRATGRRTTQRVDDRAYLLLGFFGVYVPTIYGKEENVFVRLETEIMKSSDIDQVFLLVNLAEETRIIHLPARHTMGNH